MRALARLVPRSLVAQLMLAVAAALFAAQAVNFWLVSRAQQGQYLAQASNNAAGRIAVAQAGINRFGPDFVDGPSVLEDILGAPLPTEGSGPLRRLMVSDRPPALPAGARADPALAGAVAALLRDGGYDFVTVRAWQWTPPTRADTNGGPDWPGRGPIALVAADNGQDWISARVRGRQDGRRLPAILIGQTVLIYLALLLPILFISWQASRPLRALTEAVRAASIDDPLPPVKPQGPDDVRDLIAGFHDYQSRLAAALADKDRMLGAVGHDLRTPLASLRVRVEAVADNDLRDSMVQSIDAMTVQINDILALARGDDGTEPVELVDVATLTEILAAEYRARNLDVAWTSPNALALARVRPHRFSRAIRNLIDNAVTYGQRARVGVTSEGRMAVISISDDGPGLTDDQRDALSRPFARGEASRSRATGGSGLGLTLAHDVITGEGGTLTLVNRDGGGLDAIIRLPLVAMPPVQQ